MGWTTDSISGPTRSIFFRWILYPSLWGFEVFRHMTEYRAGVCCVFFLTVSAFSSVCTVIIAFFLVICLRNYGGVTESLELF